MKTSAAPTDTDDEPTWRFRRTTRHQSSSRRLSPEDTKARALEGAYPSTFEIEEIGVVDSGVIDETADPLCLDSVRAAG